MIRHVELQTSFFHFPFLEVQWAGVPTLSLLSLVCTRCRWQTSAFIRKDCSVMIRDLSWTWLPFSNSHVTYCVSSPSGSPTTPSISLFAGREGHFLWTCRLGLPPMQRGISLHESTDKGKQVVMQLTESEFSKYVKTFQQGPPTAFFVCFSLVSFCSPFWHHSALWWKWHFAVLGASKEVCT